ncbi:hypothetical protein TVAG_382870 [Trichomonas vaginalis G3]|uniref:Uncharacterized protein n=1 Tax=Trichomonas vaginalis (strain ATCC PRA-98 / G3) TaxID=412133 RepID=A2FJL5_TRIV3|nr:protein kinase protein [Trichomonas vaginalis G3]EAX94902.1 hypothetical protein TVAG_382870 [Trichomonas vaginalis G3]KAI5482412.1 protein kinase protein [Trichomonas vaginalis G3]|eukprot:XP_001307832.1 hypothetical protein [Trichomonas vaginalis G3]
MSESPLDALRTISDGSNYIMALSSIHRNIKPDEIEEFFNIVFGHLQDSVAEDIGMRTLQTIARVLQLKSFREVFIEKQYIHALPYNQKNLNDGVLDVLYVLVTHAPQAFDQEAADGFARAIVRNPRKSLIILSIYATYFDQLENPWPLLDDLIQGQRRFSVDACAKEYCLLLAYLVTEHLGFRRGRSKQAFDCVAQNLESDSEEVVIAAYSALASIVSVEQNVIIPFREVRSHLAYRYPDQDVHPFQDAVLDFLLVAPLNWDDLANPKFLSTLLELAKTEAKASLVLCRLAEDVKVAQALVDSPRWLKRELPTSKDTLRLFLVVFKHLPMRPIIARKEEFISFLRRVNAYADEPDHSLLCTIIRRINLDKELVSQLSKSGFIAEYLGNADDFKTDNAAYSAILFTDTICKDFYTKELIPMCETVCQIIQSGGDNQPAAIKLATDMCRHAKCVRKFQELKLNTYLKNRISKMKNRGHIRKLIGLIEGLEE